MIVVDLDVPWVLDPAELKSKCKNTPFDEARLQGRVRAHHRCRTHGLRIRLTATVARGLQASMLHSLDSIACPSCAAALAFGYLLGSIPFGLILTRLAGTQDIRAIGSGNIGATNVLRTGRKGLAAATLLCDMLKGTLAVLSWRAGSAARMRALLAGARRLPRPPVSGLARVQGRQGRRDLYRRAARGSPGRPRWSSALIWLAVAAATRYSSLAALIASAAAPVFLWFTGDAQPRRCCFSLLTLAAVDHASRQHRAAGQRHRRQDRPEILRRRLILVPRLIYFRL